MAFDPQKAFSHKTLEVESCFSEKEAIIYALSIGFSRDPMNTNDLRYTFEMDENFSIFPTFACVLNKDISLLESITSIQGVPEFNPMMVLHGEHTVEIFRTLVPGIKYFTTGELHDISEKEGKGTVISYKFTSYEEDENKQRILAFHQIFTVFVRKLFIGGFKGKQYKLEFPEIPQLKPDFIYEEQTRPEQAVIYRLNGDYNPLHIDPVMAEIGGFKQPILHGLCFYGIAAKAVSQTVLKGRSELIQKIQFRFTSSVFPGETLQYQIWRVGSNRVIVTGKTLERGLMVLKGYIEFKEQPRYVYVNLKKKQEFYHYYMQPLKKKGVIIFLENFVLPYHKGISHFAKLTYAQKNFLNPSAPKSEDNSKQPSSQPPVQNIQSIGVGSSLLQYNNGRGFQEPQIFSDMTGGVQVQNYNVQPGLQPDVQSEYQLKQAFIQSQQQDQQVRKQVQDDFDSDRITFDYPKFDVIGVINKQISNRQKQPYSAERYYYNVGTKINLLQSEKEFMKYKISPKNLTPFVKLKKIQNNEYSRKLKNNKSIPLKLNNTYRPYDSLSAEELDFIVYDGVKLFMCEYEEIRMSKESFQYVLDNYSQIEQVVDTIIQRINMESTPAESSEIMENLEYSSEDKLLLEQKFYQEKMNDPAFQQEYERVKYLYKKVFEIFNHIDQKFFFRSRSVEWSDKKYQFIHGNIKQQLQLIQNLGRSLKFWGDEN